MSKELSEKMSHIISSAGNLDFWSFSDKWEKNFTIKNKAPNGYFSNMNTIAVEKMIPIYAEYLNLIDKENIAKHSIDLSTEQINNLLKTVDKNPEFKYDTAIYYDQQNRNVHIANVKIETILKKHLQIKNSIINFKKINKIEAITQKAEAEKQKAESTKQKAEAEKRQAERTKLLKKAGITEEEIEQKALQKMLLDQKILELKHRY